MQDNYSEVTLPWYVLEMFVSNIIRMLDTDINMAVSMTISLQDYSVNDQGIRMAFKWLKNDFIDLCDRLENNTKKKPIKVPEYVLRFFLMMISELKENNPEGFLPFVCELLDLPNDAKGLSLAYHWNRIQLPKLLELGKLHCQCSTCRKEREQAVKKLDSDDFWNRL
jgi:hypothetical protein